MFLQNKYIRIITSIFVVACLTIAMFPSIIGVNITKKQTVLIEPPVEKIVSEYFDEGMITLSFDDGWMSHYINAMPILDAAKIKGSFYIISNYIQENNVQVTGYMSLKQLLSLQESGHEIGSHTRTHPHLIASTDDMAEKEIKGSMEALLKMGIHNIDTFVYPYGDFDDRIIELVQRAGYIGARGALDRGYNTREANPYNLSIQDVNRQTDIETIQSWIDEAKENNLWLILMMHRIDNSGEFYGNTPEILQNIVDYIKIEELKTVTISEGISFLNN